ncbi:hypothetical protein [Amycolatopsis coloradensis]|uniref:hypothetical protein n=1 Tax=Amycolatopsis coloradensis TaxID=76021 RepID=UPI001ABFDFFB|nr:hypothetical protein [Amycolatopsis coloradensis]
MTALPRRSLLIGLFTFIGDLSSIAAPIVIVTDESFAPGFAYVIVITIAGILS